MKPLSPAMKRAILGADIDVSGVGMLIGVHPRTMQALEDRGLIDTYGNAGDYRLTVTAIDMRTTMIRNARTTIDTVDMSTKEGRAAAAAAAEVILDSMPDGWAGHLIPGAEDAEATPEPVPAGWDTVGTSTEDALAAQEEHIKRSQGCRGVVNQVHSFRTFGAAGVAEAWSACIVCNVTETQADYVKRTMDTSTVNDQRLDYQVAIEARRAKGWQTIAVNLTYADAQALVARRQSTNDRQGQHYRFIDSTTGTVVTVAPPATVAA